VVSSRIGHRFVSARRDPTPIRTSAKPHSQRVNRDAATSRKRSCQGGSLCSKPREGHCSPVCLSSNSALRDARDHSVADADHAKGGHPGCRSPAQCQRPPTNSIGQRSV